MKVSLEASKLRPGHISVQSEGDNHPLTRPFHRAYNELRSIDGIDEFTSLMGQLLPKLGQSILSVGILVPATPFVAIGAAGAISECRDEFKEIYPGVLLEVLRNKTAIFTQMRKEGVSEEDIAATQKTLDKAVKFLEQNGSAALRYEVEQYRRSEDSRSTALVDRNASALCATGMTGMAAGMFPAIGQGMAGIVEQAAGPLSNLGMDAAAAGSALGTISAGIFLPAQIAMAAHGVTKIRSGLHRDKVLKGDASALTKLSRDAQHGSALQPNALTSGQELISRKRKHNAYHSIGYGAMTASGQSLMAAGSVASLTGAGLVIGVPMSAVGAPLTIAGAVARIVHLKKEKKSLGTDASPAAKSRAMHLEKTIEHDGLVAAAQKSSAAVADTQRFIVQSKLHSLIQKSLDKEVKTGFPEEPRNRMDKVAYSIKCIETGFPKGTSLLDGDILELKLALSKYYAQGFFEGNAEDVQRTLNAAVLVGMELSRLPVSEQTLRKTLKGSARELLKSKGLSAASRAVLNIEPHQRRRDFSLDQLIEMTGSEPAAADIFSRQLSKNLASQIRTDSKFLRHDAVEQLVKVARTVTSRSDSYKDKDGNRITRF